MRALVSKRRILAGVMALTLAAGYGMTGTARAAEAPGSTDSQVQAASLGEARAGAAPVEPLRRRGGFCRVMDTAEWYLLTGQYSEYGGTWCVRR